VTAVVTGGAGFIGSNVAAALLAEGQDVIVVDNLSTGSRDRIPEGAEFVERDVADPATFRGVLDGVDVVHHLAARRAVLRSVDDPLGTDRANTFGTLCVLQAALEAGVRRVVVTSSSSVYGAPEIFPTPETTPVRPRSPYAVSKVAGEHYARVFSELHRLETVALRPFNVYGAGQPLDSQYALVIPAFLGALRSGRSPEVHGDGTQSRDFTHISDVVNAFRLAASAPPEAVSGRVYNVGGGKTHTLLELLELMRATLGVDIAPTFRPTRAGDVNRTHADISAARRDLGYEPAIDLSTGIRLTAGV
jgi:UDP-glucose 4-epimerase